MRKEQKDIADLGPIGIPRESFKLFFAHAKFFLLIQLTLVLPVVIVHRALQYTFRPRRPLAHASPLPGSGNFNDGIGSSSDTDSDLLTSTTQQLRLSTVVIQIGIAFAYQAAQALATSAVLYSVGLIYAGKRVGFLDVLRAAIPRLYIRLTVTTLYYFFLDYSMITIIHLLPNFAISRFLAGHSEIVIWTTLVKVGVSLVPTGYLQIIFDLASGISVVEEDYGWSAFKKAMKLLQGKRWVAVWFHILLYVSTIISVLPPFFLGWRSMRYDQMLKIEQTMSPTFRIVGTVVDIAWITFSRQMTSLFVGVQYASFKAYHTEKIYAENESHSLGEMDPARDPAARDALIRKEQ